jgi:hypothetical protein
LRRLDLATEGSIIPGETEEDGLLHREYVFIADTRAVEFNRAVDVHRQKLVLHAGGHCKIAGYRHLLP